MSSEIAVWNTQGVAIAADSAVTITIGDDKEKTYFSQQKIFELCKKHAIGIMVYGNSRYMGIEWEIIINEFGKYAESTNFNSLEDCVKQFNTVFLRDFRYITEKQQKDNLKYISLSFFSVVKMYYDEEIEKNYKDQEITKSISAKALQSALKRSKNELDEANRTSGFADTDGFVNENQSIIIEKIKEVFSDISLSDKLIDEMLELFMQDLIKLEIARWGNIRSGIVFVGYGDNEIFPSVIRFDLFTNLGKNILIHDYSVMNIEDEFDGKIYPFAQDETITSILWGIVDDYNTMIDNELNKFTEKLISKFGKKINDETNEQINEMKKEFNENIIEFGRDKYFYPIRDMIASLPKMELARTAEAMIDITALKQHISPDIVTVGGKTNVALITKTDGFAWIKKSNYSDE